LIFIIQAHSVKRGYNSTVGLCNFFFRAITLASQEIIMVITARSVVRQQAVFAYCLLKPLFTPFKAYYKIVLCVR